MVILKHCLSETELVYCEATNYAAANLNNDALIRNTNPSFQNEVENQVLKSLKENSASENIRRKLINWKIQNSGQQTIIVL